MWLQIKRAAEGQSGQTNGQTGVKATSPEHRSPRRARLKNNRAFEAGRGPPEAGLEIVSEAGLQGYLAHKKTLLPRTLP